MNTSLTIHLPHENGIEMTTDEYLVENDRPQREISWAEFTRRLRTAYDNDPTAKYQLLFALVCVIAGLLMGLVE